jgi:metallo-beta-lactamase family protein
MKAHFLGATGTVAGGIRGRHLAELAETARIHGEDVAVRVRVELLDHLSAQGVRDELVAWLQTEPSAPRRLLVTHGEAQAATAFSEHVRGGLGWSTQFPTDGEVVTLG